MGSFHIGWLSPSLLLSLFAFLLSSLPLPFFFFKGEFPRFSSSPLKDLPSQGASFTQGKRQRRESVWGWKRPV